MANSNLISLFPDQDKDIKIITFLKAMPTLYFSDKGLENIAKRFNTSINHIQSLINKIKGGQNNGYA
jgi:hypothetical protein